MTTIIGNRYEFISGHWLPNVPDGHKCRRPHGHNYEMEVVVTGEIQYTGFIIDFYDLDEIVKPLLEKLDHQMLNDIDGLENPTAEIIAAWFRVHIQNMLPSDTECVRVQIWETKNCWAISQNPDF